MEDPEDMRLPTVAVPGGLSPQAARNMGELAALVGDCTQRDPRQRPSFHEICLRLKHLPPRSSNSVLASPMACDSPGPGAALRANSAGSVLSV